jgi:hypothetical protein
VSAFFDRMLCPHRNVRSLSTPVLLMHFRSLFIDIKSSHLEKFIDKKSSKFVVHVTSLKKFIDKKSSNLHLQFRSILIYSHNTSLFYFLSIPLLLIAHDSAPASPHLEGAQLTRSVSGAIHARRMLVYFTSYR